MNTPKIITAGLVFTALLITGCSTIESRINEKSEVFAGLAPEEKQVIRNGYIAEGFSTDMVYMALGKPEKIVQGPGPAEETWVYHNFYANDGSGLGAPTKVNTHTAAGGARGNKPGQTPQSTTQGYNNTFTVDYDPAAENIKSESTVKVHVKFIEQEVSTIEITGGHRV